MQKVVGSSPIIRFTKAPLSGVFVLYVGDENGFCKRNCKRTPSILERDLRGTFLNTGAPERARNIRAIPHSG